MKNNRLSRYLSPRLEAAEPVRRCRLEECRAACCLFGAWVDLAEVNEILAHQKLILPYLNAHKADPLLWFDDRQEPDEAALSGFVRHTLVLSAPEHYGGTACVFLRRDNKCAVQVAAEESGLHPWRFKPFYCILHPLELDAKGQITLDETDDLLAEPGSCLRSSPHQSVLRDVFSAEIDYLLRSPLNEQGDLTRDR